ncbi:MULTISPECIES: DUF2799 domain-containing protein [unclassified Duganella]|uniref:DUF2799 domain-containing protein n=1 Tax=unclassified Duganella TaxID=2636909 RepID=UPI000E35405C|nr:MULTISPECIES: DUF2799 domain-containing protein [unclassified Duganella]RFP08122.1 DUF2799 domain-containing protein [Duganella sp. BJB475]RFP36197.1 DUF2799 domain-containing protein [Duganella sp. BJB476]
MNYLTRFRPLILALPLLLAGCQSTMQRIADCKVGDWTAIGHKDGVQGEPSDYAERKDFCDDHSDDKKPAAIGAEAQYIAGWAQGNWDLWSQLGQQDGGKGLQPQYDAHAASDDVRKHKTPLNRPAYDAGWAIGNSEYWKGLGKRSGTDGQPLSAQKDAARARAAGMQLRFDEAAYTDGWQIGNRTFWQDAGYTDARNGTPDSAFRDRASNARSAGVQVQEEAYRAAWNGEIVNYWRNLGTQDAVSGKDFAMRSKEARAKGLKIFESEYRQAWEARLTDYWRQTGADDGYGKPFMLDDRIANAGRNGVFVIAATRDLYTAAWDEQNARYCMPENAFERGRTNSGMAVEVCRGELRNQLKHAYVSGQDYEVAAAKYRQAVDDANEISGRLNDARHRLDRLQREIRSNLEAKDRVVNDDTRRQDARREQERRDLIDYIRQLERQLDDARRWVERHEQQMQRLRREIY